MEETTHFETLSNGGEMYGLPFFICNGKDL
jgi:hypothetical protein